MTNTTTSAIETTAVVLVALGGWTALTAWRTNTTRGPRERTG